MVIYWVYGVNKDAALCIFCNKYIKHDNQGLPQLIQHARGQDNGNVTCESAKDAKGRTDMGYEEHVFTF